MTFTATILVAIKASEQPVSACDLATKFETTPRSIRKALDALLAKNRIHSTGRVMRDGAWVHLYLAGRPAYVERVCPAMLNLRAMQAIARSANRLEQA